VAEPHIRLTSLSKRFGHNPPAVDDVSLEVPRGSFTTLLGPSGCGKTTTLRMIAGFYEPDVGDIFLGDRRINDVPAHRRGTAMVFQDYALFPHMSVAENVGYGLKLAGVKTQERQARVAETLRFLGLTGLDARSPSQLSGGQQQRGGAGRGAGDEAGSAAAGRAALQPDAKLRLSIRDELTSIQRQLGYDDLRHARPGGSAGDERLGRRDERRARWSSGGRPGTSTTTRARRSWPTSLGR
jgi:ABC-type Fe3+/spermidine/putrescine transport system ATPase subunit